jgi:hypothetical protein
MFTLNKLKDTLSHVGGLSGEFTVARRLSIFACAAGADSFAQRDFV